MSIKRELDLLAQYTKGFGINVGCGAQPIGNSIGVDCDDVPAATIKALAYDLPFHDETLDHVVACNVFEHIDRGPITTLREWARILKVGGVCAVVVPDADYGMWAMTGDRGIPGQLCKPERAMEHVHCFTTTTLRLLFEFAGFKVVSLEVIDREPERRERTILCVGLKTDGFVK